MVESQFENIVLQTIFVGDHIIGTILARFSASFINLAASKISFCEIQHVFHNDNNLEVDCLRLQILSLRNANASLSWEFSFACLATSASRALGDVVFSIPVFPGFWDKLFDLGVCSS